METKASTDRRDSPYTKAAILLLANAGFVLVGVVRMKLTAIELGTAALGAFGQAYLLQLLVATLAVAGLVTAGRVRMSDGRLTAPERVSVAGKLLRRPTIFASILVVPCLALSQLVSNMYVGTTAWWYLFAAASAGIVPMVFAQTAITVIQVLGSRRELLRAAAAHVILGTAIVIGMVTTGNTYLSSASFLVVPLAQASAVIAASPTVRSAIRTRGSCSLSSGQSSSVGRASLLAGVMALAADSVFRSSLAQTHGLIEVALLQPSQLFAFAAFGLITSALTQSLMVDHNRFTDRHADEFVSGPWMSAIAVSALLSILAITVLLLSPVLIPIFFSHDLLPGLAALALALAGEPLRALSWIGGSTMLPQGRTALWLMVQVTALLVQSVVTVILLPGWGALAITAGVAAGSTAAVIVSAIGLKPALPIRAKLIGLSVVLSVSAAAAGVLLEVEGVVVSAGLCAVALAWPAAHLIRGSSTPRLRPN